MERLPHQFEVTINVDGAQGGNNVVAAFAPAQVRRVELAPGAHGGVRDVIRVLSTQHARFHREDGTEVNVAALGLGDNFHVGAEVEFPDGIGGAVVGGVVQILGTTLGIHFHFQRTDLTSPRLVLENSEHLVHILKVAEARIRDLKERLNQQHPNLDPTITHQQLDERSLNLRNLRKLLKVYFSANNTIPGIFTQDRCGCRNCSPLFGYRAVVQPELYDVPGIPSYYQRYLKVCGRCMLFTYCSKGCQKAHWRRGHREECRPYAPGQPIGHFKMEILNPAVIDRVMLTLVNIGHWFPPETTEERANLYGTKVGLILEAFAGARRNGLFP